MKSLQMCLLAASLFILLAIAPAFAGGPFTVVAGGLQDPRGLAFGPGGRLYVAQAGAGGATLTGKITEIRYPWLSNPAIHDVVTGLISVGTPEGGIVRVAGLSTRQWHDLCSYGALERRHRLSLATRASA